MSFAITLHPISEAELARYVFEIAEHPELAEQRVLEIAAEKEKQEFLLTEVYGNFKELKEQRSRGVETYMGVNYTYPAAQVAGFLRPCIQASGACVTILAVETRGEPWNRLIQGLTEIPGGDLTGCFDDRESWFGLNGDGWGYVRYDDLDELKRAILDPAHEDLLDEWWPDVEDVMLENIEYCMEHKTGFLEATDVIDPFRGTPLTYDPKAGARFDSKE